MFLLCTWLAIWRPTSNLGYSKRGALAARENTDMLSAILQYQHDSLLQDAYHPDGLPSWQIIRRLDLYSRIYHYQIPPAYEIMAYIWGIINGGIFKPILVNESRFRFPPLTVINKIYHCNIQVLQLWMRMNCIHCQLDKRRQAEPAISSSRVKLPTLVRSLFVMKSMRRRCLLLVTWLKYLPRLTSHCWW